MTREQFRHGSGGFLSNFGKDQEICVDQREVKRHDAVHAVVSHCQDVTSDGGRSSPDALRAGASSCRPSCQRRRKRIFESRLSYPAPPQTARRLPYDILTLEETNARSTTTPPLASRQDCGILGVRSVPCCVRVAHSRVTLLVIKGSDLQQMGRPAPCAMVALSGRNPPAIRGL